MYKSGDLLFELVPRHDSIDGFVNAMLSLIASSDSRIIDSVLTFVETVYNHSSIKHRIKMLNSNLIPGVMNIIQPRPGSLPTNMNLHARVIRFLANGLLRARSLESAVVSGSSSQSQMNDAIFERIVVPSEANIRFFCANRYIYSRGEFAQSHLNLFFKMLQICAYHSSTCTFVVSLPIALAIISLSTFLYSDFVKRLFNELISMLLKWRIYGPHTFRMGKTVIRALNSEGLDDVLDQALLTFNPNYHPNMPHRSKIFAFYHGMNCL
ncbi:hypothetical protein BLNAU_16712 [Blattamonas nauphoetae]|uniref:Uncharacterized protein n=1 Tax=Blattamonas nauphoetae TaxID=2049346 RepID=A0ABQ9X833_9EUKA|nr:hypothetical protein BLNAU_16712 [Blattamonas nauphoetae]